MNGKNEKKIIAKGHKPLQRSSRGSYFINLPIEKIRDADLKKGEQIYFKIYHALKRKKIDFG